MYIYEHTIAFSSCINEKTPRMSMQIDHFLVIQMDSQTTDIPRFADILNNDFRIKALENYGAQVISYMK